MKDSFLTFCSMIVTGKSYEVVSCRALDPDATVFLSSESETKIGNSYSAFSFIIQSSFAYCYTYICLFTRIISQHSKRVMSLWIWHLYMFFCDVVQVKAILLTDEASCFIILFFSVTAWN